MVLDGKSSQEYPVNAGIFQWSIPGPTLFLLYINDVPDVVICIIAIYVGDTTFYCKCDQASDLWREFTQKRKHEICIIFWFVSVYFSCQEASFCYKQGLI